jgi:hypothetical protein
MCHHIDSHRWEKRTTVDEESDDLEADEKPEFLVEESAEDVNLLTDGGDEE